MGQFDEALKQQGKKKFFTMKDKDQLIFQLKDLEAREDYKIRCTDQTDKQKQWINKGMVIYAKDGTEKTFEEVMKYPNNFFNEWFPHKQRFYNIQRNIIVEGEEGSFDFGTAAEKDIKSLITSIQNLGASVLNTKFIMKKIQTPGGKNSYKVEVYGTADKPKDVKPSTQINLSNIVTPKPIVNSPNEKEQALITAFKTQIPQNNQTFEVFKMAAEQFKEEVGEITEQRLKELFEM